MLVKALKGFHRSVKEVGFLRDGTLFVEANVFDDDHGDYCDTDYLAAPDVAHLKALLCRLGLKAHTDAELLEALAQLFDTALDAREALKALGFDPVHIVDLGARNDRHKVTPDAALGYRPEAWVSQAGT